MILPNKLKELMNLIQEKGYQVFLVGGSIRDYLLNLKIDDYDLTTNMPYSNLVELCDINKLHYNTQGEKHSTIGIVYKGFYVEVTCFRGLDSNKLEEDLKLRDFTMNSLVLNDKNEIVDYLNGQEDIKNKLIRSYNPQKVFSDDPLRILRMYRFQAKYGFSIEKETYKEALNNKNNLKSVAVERIINELNIILNYNPKTIMNIASDHVLDILLQDIVNDLDLNLFNQFSNKFLNIKQKDLSLSYTLLFIILNQSSNEILLNIAEKFIKKYRLSKELKDNILKLLKVVNLNYMVDIKENLFCLLSKYKYKDEDITRLNDLNNIVIKIINPKKYEIIKNIIHLYKQKKDNKELLFINELKIDGQEIINTLSISGKKVGEIKEKIYKMCFLDDNMNHKKKLIKYLEEKHNN